MPKISRNDPPCYREFDFDNFSKCPSCGVSRYDIELNDTSPDGMREASRIFPDRTDSYIKQMYDNWNAQIEERLSCPKCQRRDGRHSGRQLCDRCKRLSQKSQIEKNVVEGRHPYDNGVYGKEGGYRGGLRLNEIPDSERKDR